MKNDLKKTKCEKCNYIVSNSNYKKHIKKCNGVGPYNQIPRKKHNQKNNYNQPSEYYQAIQNFYDLNHTFMEVCEHFKLTTLVLTKMIKKNLITTRKASETAKLRGNVGKNHSEQTKQKISTARKKFLDKNPDKVPYRLNHSSKDSYPEMLFEHLLLEHNITGWVKKYQVGVYEYDFAFIQEKIDIEIDGSTHLQEKVKSKDKQRDLITNSNGWIVVRITAKELLADPTSCLQKYVLPLLKK